MRILRWVYPSLVGLLLGSLQTGLYFQLSFTLSSSFTTFLMVTLCWLIGSAVGVRLLQGMHVALNAFLLLALLAYFACAVFLNTAPFNTQLWPIYAILIIVTGFYPGVFFARLGTVYSARDLFFRENNGFILGLISSTLLFLLYGRVALWLMPILMAAMVFFYGNSFKPQRATPESPSESPLKLKQTR
jgi:hypothetical protein